MWKAETLNSPTAPSEHNIIKESRRTPKQNVRMLDSLERNCEKAELGSMLPGVGRIRPEWMRGQKRDTGRHRIADYG